MNRSRHKNAFPEVRSYRPAGEKAGSFEHGDRLSREVEEGKREIKWWWNGNLAVPAAMTIPQDGMRFFDRVCFNGAQEVVISDEDCFSREIDCLRWAESEAIRLNSPEELANIRRWIERCEEPA